MVFGKPAPHYAKQSFLKQAIAWQLQLEKWEYKQPEHNVKNIHKLLHRKLTEVNASPHKKLSLTPSTQLVREWNGKTYRVTANSDGYEYAGETYRSLTAISQLITGTAWSGPKFFGVVK